MPLDALIASAMDESDDEVEEEKVPIPPPPPPPPPAVAPVKPTYIVEAACKRFEIPQEAVLFSAYRVVPVKDGALMVSDPVAPHCIPLC